MITSKRPRAESSAPFAAIFSAGVFAPINADLARGFEHYPEVRAVTWAGAGGLAMDAPSVSEAVGHAAENVGLERFGLRGGEQEQFV